MNIKSLLDIGLVILMNFCGIALSDTDILLKGPENGWYINGGPVSSQIGSWYLYEDNLYSVCDTHATNREPTNWLRTDFIDVKDAIRVDIVVNYTVRKCQAGKKYCKEYFKLYGYQTSKTSPKPNPLVTPFNFLAQAKPTNIPLDKSGPGDFNQLSVSIKTTSKGLYLAFYDQGACLSLLGVIVSFHYCPERGDNLVSFVRTVSPYSDASAYQVEGLCADKHSNNSTILTAFCMSDGNWKKNDSVRCLCIKGYEYVEKPKPHCKEKPEHININVKISGNKEVYCQGDSIHVKCTSNTKPAPFYWLYRNNVFLGKNRNGVFVVRLTEKGNNIITCVTNHTVGGRKSKTKSIIAIEPPKITGCRINSCRSTSQPVVEGDVVTVTCDISGDPPLSGRWTKGEQVWNGNKLVFDPINRTDAGYYKFILRNGGHCNSSEQEVYISVIFTDSYFHKETKSQHTNKTVVVLGVLLAMAIVLINVLIVVIFWLRNKDQNRKSAGKRMDTGDVQTNDPIPYYERGDRLVQSGLVSNPPSVAYQTIQPHTADYGLLSPLTRLRAEDTVPSSTGSPTREGEYQALQQHSDPQYQPLAGMT